MEMNMEQIKVMISSVVKGLESERSAIKEFFDNIPFVECVGAYPFDEKSLSGSSAMETIRMARDCDLYILILSERYGYKIMGEKSATEVEYDTAIKDNPSKVLVFLKSIDSDVEVDQQAFIDKVSDYHQGYFRTTFNTKDKLIELVKQSFYNWIVRKCKNYQTCSDQFIRVIQENFSMRGYNLYYETSDSQVVISIVGKKNTTKIKYEKTDIMKNFWKCTKDFQVKLDKSNEEG